MRWIFAALVLALGSAWGQDAPSMGAAPMGRAEAPAVEAAPVVPIASHYDKKMFLKPLPADQTAFLKQFDGAPTSDLMHDKDARRMLKAIVPDCTFHYGRDMSLNDALDMVMKDSREPVRVRDGRYLLASGMLGPYLGGRAFVWIDLQEGVGLGGFWFHPTNGEPSPTLAVFGRQVKPDQLSTSELPPAFDRDLVAWDDGARISPVGTRYFISGANERILLEHDEDFCSPTDGSVADPACEQMNADAADLDETAAYYLDQVHYRTNATAWMIGADQVAWIGVRERSCGNVVDPLGCRIRVTRAHTHLIVGRRGKG